MKVIECPLARAAKSDLDSRSQLKSFLNITPSSTTPVVVVPEAVIVIMQAENVNMGALEDL